MPTKKNIDHYKHSEQNSGIWFGKPYHFFGDYLFDKYGTRVLKLPIDAGLLCPNRDGKIGHEGCIFCSSDGSASPTSIGLNKITDQMENAKKSFKRSDIHTKYIAYFQAFTNTYADRLRLKGLYNQALSVKDVIGLMIATRPDCISDTVFDLIADYKRDNFELWLEIGMQSMHEKSLAFMKRGHTHNNTKESVYKASQRKIPVCAHIILGIPNESWADMMETAKEVSSLPISGVKFHHLHVIKGTKLEKYYNEHKINIISFKEYVSTIVDFIERLRPDILIHRLIGDRQEESLIAPKWALQKGTVIKAIEDEFKKRYTYQGFLCNNQDIKKYHFL